MTTRTKTQTDDLDAETEAVLAEWKQKKDDDRLQRARGVATRRLTERRRAAMVHEPGYWAPRLARHGMAAVTAAPGWEQCPVPANSASAVNFSGYPTDPHRPVAYYAAVWTLDERGIHLRTGGYQICSPMFQIQRGVNGATDRFAVLVDGTWRIVDGPPIPANGPATATDLFIATLKLLIAAGLVLNRQPLPMVAGREPLATIDNPDLVAMLQTNGWVTESSAGSQLVNFLNAHKTEAPMRDGNRR